MSPVVWSLPTVKRRGAVYDSAYSRPNVLARMPACRCWDGPVNAETHDTNGLSISAAATEVDRPLGTGEWQPEYTSNMR